MGMIMGAALLLTLPGAAEANGATVTFADKANPHAVSGFGGEWDPHFWREANTRRGCNEAEWKKVCDKIRDIGIARVRMMILPDWYEPENDNADPANARQDAFTWDSVPMKSLRRHLDFCQEAGIRVIITWWCAPTKRQSDDKPYWLACHKVDDWCSAPNSIPEAAENIVAGLRHLLVDKGYTCIDEFTYINEPDWTYKNDEGVIDFDHYIACCRAIQDGLRAAGLRDRIRLNLADASAHQGWLEKCAANLGDVADSYNSHSYVFCVNDKGYPKAISEWIAKWVTACGDKPFATNELGTRNYTGAYGVSDLETFERAFTVSQYAILGLNQGMTGALFWGLYDQYYYDGDDPNDGSNGGMMKTNLMGYITEDWKIRPTGQVWSLICHGAPIGAKVFPGVSGDPDVDAVALAASNDGVSVLLANRAKDPRSVNLQNIPGSSVAAPTKLTAFTRDGLKDLMPGDAPEVLAVPAESVVLAVYKGRGE